MLVFLGNLKNIQRSLPVFCGCRITAITRASQARDGGSTPLIRCFLEDVMNTLFRVIATGLCFLIIVGCTSGLTPNQNQQKKDRLLVFLGSDWDEQSADLLKQVLTDDTVTALEKTYTVEFHDILRSGEKSAQTMHDQVSVIFGYYSITSVPWFVLSTAEGDVYAREKIPTHIVSADDFFLLLESKQTERAWTLTQRERISKSTGADKTTAIDLFLTDAPFVSDETRRVLVTQATAADPKNLSGLLPQYTFLATEIRASDYAREGQLVKAGDEFIMAVKSGILDSTYTQSALYTAAYYYALSGKVATAVLIDYLKQSRAACPQNTEMSLRIEQAITHLTRKAGH